jgi:hypothetical protein
VNITARAPPQSPEKQLPFLAGFALLVVGASRRGPPAIPHRSVLVRQGVNVRGAWARVTFGQLTGGFYVFIFALPLIGGCCSDHPDPNYDEKQAGLGLGRIVALNYRSSTSYHIH